MGNSALPAAVLCQACGQAHTFEPLERHTVAKCRRCGATMARRSTHSLHVTGALCLTALILYVPANVYPILELDMYGAKTQNTIWDGCVRLYQDGDVIVAAIVFLASILIPLLKLAGLFFLVISAKVHHPALKVLRSRLYRIIEAVGRWAMLDVFVLAVLVSVVKLGALATIIPGPGLFAFAMVVVCTILASASFDPQMIWENQETPS